MSLRNGKFVTRVPLFIDFAVLNDFVPVTPLGRYTVRLSMHQVSNRELWNTPDVFDSSLALDTQFLQDNNVDVSRLAHGSVDLTLIFPGHELIFRKNMFILPGFFSLEELKRTQAVYRRGLGFVPGLVRAARFKGNYSDPTACSEYRLHYDGVFNVALSERDYVALKRLTERIDVQFRAALEFSAKSG
jgi:hypothetical protein